MRDVIMSLVSSVVAGSAVWLGQWLLRYRRLARKRAFFGITPAGTGVLVSPRHFSSPRPASVHRDDMAALVALATVVSECGGRAEIVPGGTGLPGIGRVAEFSVGGPTANPRTATHLRAMLPGVQFHEPKDPAEGLPLSVGTTVYRRSDQAGYALLAKVYAPDTAGPVFVLAGQTASTNLAAARLLAAQHRRLARRYGPSGQFCLVLRIVEPGAYGSDYVEIVADVTDASRRSCSPVPNKSGD